MNILNLFRRKPKPKRELTILSEAEFNFLAEGVPDRIISARKREAEKLTVAASLSDKGCIRPAGYLPLGENSVIAWEMTSKGIDAALGAFEPQAPWNPFKRQSND